jgi:hypothetical protein
LNKETRNAGEKPVHGFMGFLLNPKAAVLVYPAVSELVTSKQGINTLQG